MLYSGFAMERTSRTATHAPMTKATTGQPVSSFTDRDAAVANVPGCESTAFVASTWAAANELSYSFRVGRSLPSGAATEEPGLHS